MKDNNKETSNSAKSIHTAEMVPWCLGRSVMRALYDEGLFDDGTVDIGYTET